MLRACTICLAICLAHDVRAGEFNPVLNIGDDAPAWQQLPGVDGKEHSLKDLAESDVVVVVFTCNTCPYAVDYEDRIIALAKNYADRKVSVVAINVNKVDGDQLADMKARAAEKGFPYPYLHDETQKIALDYGAIYTPEFFVLNKQRKVVYMGAMDNSPNADKVTERHVEAAVEAALKGALPKTRETVAIGCRVRFQRRR